MPRLDANDDYVIIGKWLVKSGDYVDKDQLIAELETSKQTGELYAPCEGYIEIKELAGETVNVDEIVAIIRETKNTETQPAIAEETISDERKYSAKAMALIKKYGIDVSLLPANKIIREKDVLKLVKKPYTIAETFSNKLLIYGAGGFCKVALDIIKQRGMYKVCGILDRKYPDISEVCGVPVIAGNSPEEFERLFNEGYTNIFNAVAFDGNRHCRKEPYEKLKEVGFNFVNIIHNSAIIEPSITMGEGNLIAAGAIIGSEAVIGNNCIINAGAIISHDCIISDSCHIASGAVLGGNVIVGENTLIGQGCTIYKDITIGSNVVIMNGANVFRNIPDNTIVEK